MGQGLPDYQLARGIAYDSFHIYVMYFNAADLLLVQQWNGKRWNAILNTTSHYGERHHAFGLLMLQNELYVAGLITLQDTCNGTAAQRLAKWNGNCWDPAMSETGI